MITQTGNTRTDERFEAFLLGYAEAMLWTIGHDGEGEVEVYPELWQTPSPTWALEAFEPESRTELEDDCEDFFRANYRDLLAYAKHESQRWNYDTDLSGFAAAGSDFALTRNGHGAGFWDRGMGDLGERLSEASRPFGPSRGEVDLSDDAEDHLVRLH